jgi:hypothetical protein
MVEQLSDPQKPARATADRFRQIFSADMGPLYLLSFLLAADETNAEACFLSALDDCLDSGFVFTERARAWARRAVIKRAIQRIRPSPEPVLSPVALVPGIKGPELASRGLGIVMRMKAFQRFVFVMSALERYPDRECAILLNCRLSEVVTARTEALQSFSEVFDLTWQELPSILQIA